MATTVVVLVRASLFSWHYHCYGCPF